MISPRPEVLPGKCASAQDIIAARIREHGPIPFNEFMQLALHHPEAGYYAAGASRVGPQGDFITSPEVSPVFGESLARQILEMDRLLFPSGTGPFALVELGGGSGRLAADVLDTIARLSPGPAGLAGRLTLILVETSPAMRSAQRELLFRTKGERAEKAHPGAARILWADSMAEAAEAARSETGVLEGVVVSNEFFDALPVHVVTRRDGRLFERTVDLSGAGFAESERALEAGDVDDYARRYGVAAEEGMVAEIGLDAVRWIREIASALTRGFHLAIDYGHEAKDLYAPARARGTLLACSGHRTNEHFLDAPGSQDLTAHVNFTALSDAGTGAGLVRLGLTTQDRFLLSFGIAGRIESLAASNDPADIRTRLALTMLIHPEGMGRTFRLLFQAKGLEVEFGNPAPNAAALPSLTGLNDPFVPRRPEARNWRRGNPPPQEAELR